MTDEKFKQKIEEIKSQLSDEDIISFVCDGLGSPTVRYDASGNPVFTTICHGGSSEKLYYYADRQIFMCYTNCGAMDIFELTEKVRQCNFGTAYKFVCSFFHINSGSGFNFEEEKELTGDWDILQKMNDYSSVLAENPIEYSILPKNLIEFYPREYPEVWIKEGFTFDAMDKYNIRVDPANWKIIIPHYDVNGELIGIRGRSYNPLDLDKGMKYSPVWIENKCFNHALGAHLYGLDKNKDFIKKIKKVCIVESEKSVMLAESFYPNNNFVVASCGSAGLSSAQINLLLDLGVQEVILAYDRENDNNPESELSRKYVAKLEKLCQPLTTIFDVYVLYDDSPNYELLGLKDSPFDHGKETLEKLMKAKKFVPSVSEGEDYTTKRRR